MIWRALGKTWHGLIKSKRYLRRGLTSALNEARHKGRSARPRQSKKARQELTKVIARSSAKRVISSLYYCMLK